MQSSPSLSPAPLVQACNLYKSFGRQLVVDNLSLSVARGEVMGFLGPNGAGKSTTMRMLTGYLAPDDGSLAIAGHSMHNQPIAAKRHIGYLPEGSPLYSDMSVSQFLQFMAQARGLNKASITSRLDWVITTLRLEQVVYQALDTLSKGYRRRVGLAQALIHDPDVLILDEPTDGLDPVQKNDVRELIRQLAGQKAIIISTHILEEVEPLCTRVVVIAAGREVFSGLPDEMLARAVGESDQAVYLTLGGVDADQVRQQLLAIEQLASVQIIKADPRASEFELLPATGADLYDSLAALCLTNAWKIRRLASREGRLDQVFRQLVTPNVKANAVKEKL